MLTELPMVVVDNLLSKYVCNNDLRVIHQVSKGWKDLIEQRPVINDRRVALVNKIREHKENIRRSNKPLELSPEVNEPKANEESRSKERDDGKSGSGRALRTTTSNNKIHITPVASSLLRSTTHGKNERATGSIPRISSTPKSRFQRRYEAGLKLVKGQVLFSCPDCKSPVPSPLPSLLKEKKMKAFGESMRTESFDSGICFSFSVSGDDDSVQTGREDQTSKSYAFDFKSPTFDCINISMIVTPPFSPPIFEEARNHTHGSEHAQDLQQTKSPSCPFLFSASTLSISDSTSRSLDSGIGNSLEKPKSPSSLLRSYHSKLKLKSFSSPSLLVSEVNIQSQSGSPVAPPFVVECPDCSYRFCSLCKCKEHIGKSCRLIGGIEDEEEEDSHALPKSITNLSPRSHSRSTLTSNGKLKKSKKKASLRRLAYL